MWRTEGRYSKEVFNHFIFKLSLFIFGCTGSLCCAGFLSLVAARGGYSAVTVHGLLIAVAFLVAEHGVRSTGSALVAHRLSCSAACGSSGSGIEPVSPALAGRFFTAEPPGKP